MESIRGQKRKIQHIKAKTNFSIHNRFDVFVTDIVTGKTDQKAYAENIILDALWTRLFTPTTYFNAIHYGTGTGMLVASRTSLFTFLNAKAAVSQALSYNWDEGWISNRKQCQLTETENVGSALSELGIGYGTVSTNLVTHAKLKDMNGNDVSITKTATDIITIYATVFLHWDTSGYDSGFIKISPFANNLFLIKYLLGDYSSTYQPKKIVAFKGEPAALFLSNTTDANPTNTETGPEAKTVTLLYDAANKKISIAATRFAATAANQNGVRCISLMSGPSSYKYPSINFYVGGSWHEKTTIIGEVIGTGDGVTKAFKTAFGFVKPGAKIYYNNVEQTSGITVTPGLPYEKNKMAQYFEELFDFSTATDDYYSIATGLSLGHSSNIKGPYAIYYNPFYAYGILSFKSKYVRVEVSDDLINWTTLVNMGSYIVTTTVAVENRQKKYWKITGTTATSADVTTCYEFTADTLPDHNIDFSAAPALGAVITADYDTATIAKDAFHVYDFSFEITLAEKTS